MDKNHEMNVNEGGYKLKGGEKYMLIERMPTYRVSISPEGILTPDGNGLPVDDTVLELLRESSDLTRQLGTTGEIQFQTLEGGKMEATGKIQSPNAPEIFSIFEQPIVQRGILE